MFILLLTLGMIFDPWSAGAAETENKVGASSTKDAALTITLHQAVLMTLENNRSLVIERLNPLISQTVEEEAQAVFDPSVSAEIESYRAEGLTVTSSGTVRSRNSADSISVSGSQFLPSGTVLGLDLESGRLGSDRSDNSYTARMGLSVTQALLRGRGLDVNLATLRQARLDTRISQYELHGFSEALVATVEETYWNYILARNQIRIFENSLSLAEKQLQETEEIIQVGKMAETEMVAAQAEIALRRQGLIEARSIMATTRLNLLRLLNPPGPNLWNRELLLVDQPVIPKIRMGDVESHVKVALRLRPEIKQAELEIELGELQLVKTKNGLLPRLDLFISLGKTGYADSFGDSVSNITGDDFDFTTGLRFEYPLRNREAKALHRRATLNDRRAREALDNLSQLIELDVRTAYIELSRAEKQISASRATLALEEEKVRIEKEKFRVGKSTSFLVAQAQRDLLQAQILEIKSVASYLQGLVRLFRLEGSLLERWGIKIEDTG
jgi:outer membrane protein TolC